MNLRKEIFNNHSCSLIKLGLHLVCWFTVSEREPEPPAKTPDCVYEKKNTPGKKTDDDT